MYTYVSFHLVRLRLISFTTFIPTFKYVPTRFDYVYGVNKYIIYFCLRLAHRQDLTKIMENQKKSPPRMSRMLRLFTFHFVPSRFHLVWQQKFSFDIKKTNVVQTRLVWSPL